MAAIVLTNDDSITAPGLAALQQALIRVTGQPGVVIAPLLPHSGCGHQVTTDRPIRIEAHREGAYAIEGTPADCTRIALSHLCPNAAFVLSGINAGGNLGSDVYISGTVAAVREAAFHRVPGIAISHFIQRGRAIDWDLATHLATRVLDKLLHSPSQSGSFWNVNLPHLAPGAPDPEIILCPLCTQPLPNHYQQEGETFRYVGEYSKRRRDPGSDVEVCFSGSIAVTQIQI